MQSSELTASIFPNNSQPCLTVKDAENIQIDNTKEKTPNLRLMAGGEISEDEEITRELCNILSNNTADHQHFLSAAGHREVRPCGDDNNKKPSTSTNYQKDDHHRSHQSVEKEADIGNEESDGQKRDKNFGKKAMSGKRRSGGGEEGESERNLEGSERRGERNRSRGDGEGEGKEEGGGGGGGEGDVTQHTQRRSYLLTNNIRQGNAQVLHGIFASSIILHCKLVIERRCSQ